MKFLILTVLLFITATAAFAQHVILHEGPRNNNAYIRYGIGTHFLKNTYMNNKAQSVTVPPGYWINLCDEHPQRERGDPSCTSLPEGNWEIRELRGRVSYLNVTMPSEPLGSALARVYANKGQQGTSFYISTARTEQLGANWIGLRSAIDGQPAPTWKQAGSSIWIARGYRAIISRVGNNMIGGTLGHPVQITLAAGKHDFNADFDGKTVWVRIEKVTFTRPRPRRS